MHAALFMPAPLPPAPAPPPQLVSMQRRRLHPQGAGRPGPRACQLQVGVPGAARRRAPHVRWQRNMWYMRAPQAAGPPKPTARGGLRSDPPRNTHSCLTRLQPAGWEPAGPPLARNAHRSALPAPYLHRLLPACLPSSWQLPHKPGASKPGAVWPAASMGRRRPARAAVAVRWGGWAGRAPLEHRRPLTLWPSTHPMLRVSCCWSKSGGRRAVAAPPLPGATTAAATAAAADP